MQAVLNARCYNMIQFAFAPGKIPQKRLDDAYIGLHVKKTLSVPETGTTLDNLAQLYPDQGLYQEAEPLYQRALAIREKTLPENHPWIALALEHYAGLLRQMNRPGEAAQLEARANAIRAKRQS
jgi:tetratricopeptide (TPR) repeat protein